jgi:hypothetical protein
MVIGLPMDCTGFAAVAPAARPRAHRHDLRPARFSRSTIGDPEQDSAPELVADDVHRVLAALTADPVPVFESSGGGATRSRRAGTPVRCGTGQPANACSRAASARPPFTSPASPRCGPRPGESWLGLEGRRPGQLAHRTAAALARHLGTPLVEFPGSHAGLAGQMRQSCSTAARRSIACPDALNWRIGRSRHD